MAAVVAASPGPGSPHPWGLTCAGRPRLPGAGLLGPGPPRSRSQAGGEVARLPGLLGGSVPQPCPPRSGWTRPLSQSAYKAIKRREARDGVSRQLERL